MPSAPKYKKRRKGDFYPTPDWCTQALLEYYDYNFTNTFIAETSAGRGNISRVLKEYCPEVKLVQFELYKNKHLEQYGEVTYWGDFLKRNPPNKMSYLSTRPSFTGDGKSDSSVYAWFHWYEEERKDQFDAPAFLLKGDK